MYKRQGLVDFGQGFFEFLFALKPYLQTEIIRQMTTSLLNPVRDDIVNNMLTLGLCLAVPLLVALPQIQEPVSYTHLDVSKRQVLLPGFGTRYPAGFQAFGTVSAASLASTRLPKKWLGLVKCW